MRHRRLQRLRDGKEVAGRFLRASDVPTLVRDCETGIDEHNVVQYVFLPGVIAPDVSALGYECLRGAAVETTNRGMAAGTYDLGVPTGRVAAGGARTRRIKPDGAISNTNDAPSVQSGVAGAMDRYPRIPYCRQTSWTQEHRGLWLGAIPFIVAVAEQFRLHRPEEHARQLAMAEKTHPAWVIEGTPFTSITVNRNFQTAVHTDKGDFRQGFGVLSAFARGKYSGAHFGFPAFGISFDLRDGDVLLANVHEWHGNTPFVGAPGRYERVSCVFYYREKMARCGSPQEELERAQRRK